MAKHKLSARYVETAKPGRHGDGAGLWLEVSATGSKRWLLRFTRPDGRVTEMGLGSVADGVTLAKAREKAEAARAMKADGVDPIRERRAQRLTAVTAPTFGELADRYLAAHASGWTNEKHRFQWRHSLTVHCAAIRSTPIDELSVEAVLGVISPLWTTFPETADRVRGRIARVFDSARPLGHVGRGAHNPAAWQNNLDHLLPPRKELVRGHHAALPYKQAPAFMALLREREGVSRLALEMCILCANRTGEVIGARWEEFDLAAGLWVIPKERMKMRETHQIPLSPRAIEIVETALKFRTGEFVFPGPSGGAASNMTMTMLLRRMAPAMERAGIDPKTTVHGFRSTFRDWAGESTDYAEELCERALAHTTGSKARDAYQRMRLVERRRPLMEDWAAYCSPVRAVRLAAE